MNVILKNNAKSGIIIPGVGELAKLDGLVAPGDTISVDEQLTKTDFIQHLIETGHLIVAGTEVTVEAEPTGDIEALREQAEILGIEVDKRWKAGRLREEIAKLIDA